MTKSIEAFSTANPENAIEVSQIKQKFGGLLIYYHNTPEDIRQLIDEAIEASWHTCERCGATEGITTNLEGYWLTLCQECRSKVTCNKGTTSL